MINEIKRKKIAYEKHVKKGGIISIVGFLLFIPLSIGIPVLGSLISIGLFMGGAIYASKYTSKIKMLSIEFKTKYLVEEMRKAFPDSNYNPNSGFYEHEVVNTGLLRNQDRFYSEDMISGSFEEVRFRCSDVKQQDVSRDSKGRTHTTTVFLGRFYEFDFPKTFKSNILIMQHIGYGLFSNYERVRMESVDFNSELKVYAENELDAFYLLTPHFMERLAYMDKKYNDKITFSFQQNKLSIAINNRKDTFDIKAFKEIDDSTIEEYIEEFNDIKSFIKVLNLDETLFKK